MSWKELPRSLLKSPLENPLKRAVRNFRGGPVRFPLRIIFSFFSELLFRIIYYFQKNFLQKSDIVFCSIHESCPQRILGSLMNIVHIQFAEDILAMGVHSMET